MVDYLSKSDTLSSLRNNALIQLGFFGAFRRSELVAIQWEHVTFSKQGIEVLIPLSKTDKKNEGQTIAIPYGSDKICAVRALKAWQDSSKINNGYIFRRIDKASRMSDKAIGSSHVNYIIKTLVTACQFDNPDQYSAHSLRGGFATEASRKGASFKSIMQQGRWKSGVCAPLRGM